MIDAGAFAIQRILKGINYLQGPIWEETSAESVTSFSITRKVWGSQKWKMKKYNKTAHISCDKKRKRKPQMGMEEVE